MRTNLVYAVFEGDYSDCRVVRVFATLKKAQQCIEDDEKNSEPEDVFRHPTIEEWEVEE